MTTLHLALRQWQIRFAKLLPQRERSLGAFWRADLVAALTISAVLIPQVMSFAQLAGLPAVYGFYGALVPVVVAALLGSSPYLSTGPTAVVSMMTLAIVSPLATPGSGGYLALVVWLALTVGVLQLLMGVFRLGRVFDRVPHAVLFGFINAAALLIAGSQLAHLLGITGVSGSAFLRQMLDLTGQLGRVEPLTALLGLGSLTLIVLGKRWRTGRLTTLLVVAGMTVLSWRLGYTGPVVGQIPAGLPVLQWPVWSASSWLALLPGALVLALVASTETLSMAKLLSERRGEQVDVNRELIGQGAANLSAGLFGAGPGDGSFSRSAVGFEAGERTKLTSVLVGFCLLLTLLFLTPLFYHLPYAVLAAVVVSAVLHLVQPRSLLRLWQTDRRGGWVAVLTFGFTLLGAPHIGLGLLVGVLSAFALKRTT